MQIALCFAVFGQCVALIIDDFHFDTPRWTPLIFAQGLLVGDGQDRHVTAESLFEAAKGQGEAVSLATVYNTLRAFCSAGLLQEVTVDGSKSYFDTNTHDHPHFFWEGDAKLTDAPADQLVITQLPNAPEGAEIASVDVVIRLRRKG